MAYSLSSGKRPFTCQPVFPEDRHAPTNPPRATTETYIRHIGLCGTDDLPCDSTFESWDRRQNRLCPHCRQAVDTQPSEEVSHAVEIPRRRG